MREYDGVGLGVRQVEGPAERVAQLVVKCHADAAKTGAAEPGAIKGGDASGDGMRVRGERGQG